MTSTRRSGPRVQIYIPESELEGVKNTAEALGLSVSEFARAAMRQYTVRLKEKGILAQTNEEYNEYPLMTGFPESEGEAWKRYRARQQLLVIELMNELGLIELGFGEAHAD